MMRRWLAAALVIGAPIAGNEAAAADMPPYGYPAQAMPVVQEFGTGWYLRGDIGYRADIKISEVVSNFPLPSNLSLDNVATIGGGAGYKWGWFRGDVTVDYAGRSAFNGANDRTGDFTGRVESTTALANLYIDLGTWGGFTPYIGAGIGATFFRARDFRPPVGNVTVDYHNQTDFTWAYMVGASYAFLPRWLVDFSYRRLNFGDMTFNPNIANALTLKDMSANEFRLGLRYMFD